MKARGKEGDRRRRGRWRGGGRRRWTEARYRPRRVDASWPASHVRARGLRPLGPPDQWPPSGPDAPQLFKFNYGQHALFLSDSDMTETLESVFASDY